MQEFKKTQTFSIEASTLYSYTSWKLALMKQTQIKVIWTCVFIGQYHNLPTVVSQDVMCMTPVGFTVARRMLSWSTASVYPRLGRSATHGNLSFPEI